jgi:hypothetical protein
MDLVTPLVLGGECDEGGAREIGDGEISTAK